jgi:CRISPR-associated protein Cas1
VWNVDGEKEALVSWLPLNPIPLKDRVSMIFLQYGQIDVIDGAFVLIDKTGVRTHVPVGSVACIMLEPGTRVSHAAVRLAAQVGTLLVWVGRQESAYMHRVSRAVRVQINCCIRQSWRWMMICV